MSRPVHVGIDLAWNTKAKSGIAVLDGSGALVESATLRSDDEIVEWLTRGAWDPVMVAIDAPLIVTNDKGQRDCEALIGKAYARFHAGAYPSNLGNVLFNPPRGGELAKRLGWNLDPEHVPTRSTPGCIEVYPHPAMVGLFYLGSVLQYKSRPHRAIEVRRAAFLALAGHIETVHSLGLTSNARWAELRSIISLATRPVDLKNAEDEIDAIFCAHLAWLWHEDRGALKVYGSLADGYIVAPPPPSHMPAKAVKAVKLAKTGKGSAARHTVASFTVRGRPATLATAEETTWKALVVEAAHLAMEGSMPPDARFAVELDFVLPLGLNANERWDLANLIKPTVNSLGPIIGWRFWHGAQQVDDERIDHIVASKRSAREKEQPGARIAVKLLNCES